MDEKKIDEILNDLETGYDEMAGKFSETRKHFWRDLEFIGGYVGDDDRVLDFGCGNGRLIEILRNKQINYVGVDVSQELISSGKERYPGYDFQKISGQTILPFNDNFFNKIISVAVFHHFPRKHAQKMANDLFRVAKPGAKVIVTVWNLWQWRFLKNIFSPKTIFSKLGRSGKYGGLGFKDIYIPFKNNGESGHFDRYHHAYTRRELSNIFSDAGFKIEKCFILSGKNIILIGSK